MQQLFKSILFPFLFILPVFGFAQTKNAPPVTLESPYNSIFVHLYYLQPNSYQPELASKTLFGIADSTLRVKRAIQLKQILDGLGLFVHLNQLPQEANYVDSLTNKAYYTPFPNDLPEVYLEKVDSQWFYSEETVGLIPTLHKKVYPFGSDLLLNLLPNLGQNRVLGLAVWQYIGIAILLVLIAALHFILSRLLNPVVRRLSQSRLSPSLVDEKLIWKIARLISFLVLLQVVRIFIPPLQLPIVASQFVVVALRIISTMLVVLLVLRILDISMLYAKRFTEKTTSKLDEQLIPIVKRMFQVVIIFAGIIQVLHLLDINVTALIAGISIGGLAIALAAQDTVKNLIGSTMIFVDQPFQIGDWIEYGGVAGTVTEVGFRTTRIQLSDSSIVSIPNGSIANEPVTNRGVRVFRLFQTTIGLTYDTPPDLIEKFIEGLKLIIESHPKTMKENYFVHFNAMADSSLNILFRTSILVEDYGGELKAKEELLFAIVRLADALGVQFAFPSSTLYVEQFPGKIGNAPVYETQEEKMNERLAAFIEKIKKQEKEG